MKTASFSPHFNLPVVHLLLPFQCRPLTGSVFQLDIPEDTVECAGSVCTKNYRVDDSSAIVRLLETSSLRSGVRLCSQKRASLTKVIGFAAGQKGVGERLLSIKGSAYRISVDIHLSTCYVLVLIPFFLFIFFRVLLDLPGFSLRACCTRWLGCG